MTFTRKHDSKEEKQVGKQEFKKVKFLHIFLHDGLRFVKKYVDMINTNPEFFDAEEHCFLTNQQRIYDELKHYGNVFLAEKSDNIVNYYGEYSDWIFIHALNLSFSQLLSIKRKYARKIIWRTWGHDIRLLQYSGNVFKRIVKFIYNYLYRRKIRQFYAVGCANDVDVLKVNSAFGRIRTIIMSYSYVENHLKTLQTIFNEMQSSDSLNILVGHSGSFTDNHIEILNRLERYKGENIKIFLPLSYGNPDYIEEIIATAKRIFADKVNVIDWHMPYFEYAKFLSDMDIAIMDQKHSAALGNIRLLAFFKKKIFINKNGDFAKALLQKQCKVYSSEDIGKIDFNTFSFVDEENAEQTKLHFGRVLSDFEFLEKSKKVFEDLKI